ncbi:MAG TPA: EF-hand domain-containing protein [Labilithrix sp.]|nr:EF-hand domain-containing protein [Labilithrix sp.]
MTSRRSERSTLARALVVLAGVLVVLCLSERRAHAEGTRTAFALVVTNNRSARLSRPDLRYADDDGAKYYEAFRMFAPESNVTLLTTFDSDTQKLFPHLVGRAKAPTKANVQASVKELAAKVAAAKLGGPVDFYFVFAGHGDIEKGKGFLELADGSFTSDDLESLLKAIPATRSHVILDSCNSFFVINSRKPGGRHFVTSEEAAKNLNARLPNVGFFLSTSAEAEVFEWSELQSGVFSHAVRSGLFGAADANRDGRVSYDELRAFVNVASKDIKNANYRPQVYARGPGGRGGDAVVDLAHAVGARVRVDANERRLTVRDQDEVPWLDMHKEAGAEVLLHLPPRLAQRAALDEASTTTGAIVRHDLVEVGAAEEKLLALLPTNAAKIEPRGPDDMFRRLFAQPFGPIAYAEHQAEEAKAEPLVLGVSTDERERLRLLLKESASSSKASRIVGGSLTLPIGLGLGALGGVMLGNIDDSKSDSSNRLNAIFGGLTIGGGVAVTTASLVDLFRPSLQERTYREFTESLALAPDTKQAQALYAEAERGLLRAAVRERRHRTWTRWVGFGMALNFGFALGVITASEDSYFSSSSVRVLLGVVALPTVVGGVMFFNSLFPTTTERMAEVWKNDPGLVRSRMNSSVQVKPYFGGLSAGLTGTF